MLIPFATRHLWLHRMATTAFSVSAVGTPRPISFRQSQYQHQHQHHPQHRHHQHHSQHHLYSSTANTPPASDDITTTPTSTTTTSTTVLEFQYRRGLEDSDYTQVLYTDHVPSALSTREELTHLLGNPRQPNEERFQWDPWFVRCDQGRSDRPETMWMLPGDEWNNDDDNNNNNNNYKWDAIPGEREAAARQVQYSMTRAQCNMIFSDKVFGDLVGDITELGRSIGCTAISPPWISLYGDGQMQNFHIDPTQGNMAWTLSLSVGYGSTFTGGETILVTPGVLDYWRDFDGSRGKEAPSLVRFLPPLFGRLTAFDPRIPHMVQSVSARGVGPLEARIMIHGWFAEPEIVWFGPELEDSEDACDTLNTCLDGIMETLSSSEIGRVMGFLSVRVGIHPDGSVSSVDAVCDTLREDPADFSGVVGYDEEGREVMEDSTADTRLTIREALGNLNFPETKDGGAVVVPFDFV